MSKYNPAMVSDVSDDGSDMDVSSDDDMVFESDQKLPHESLVQSLRRSIQQRQANAPRIQPRVETFLPSTSTQQPTYSYANSLKRALPVDDDSDTESVSSYKTAPDSFMECTDDMPTSGEDNLEHIERMITHLQEHLEATRARGDEIQKRIDSTQAKREALRIKKLEKNVRQSIMKRKRELPSPVAQDTPSEPKEQTLPNPREQTLPNLREQTLPRPREHTPPKFKEHAACSGSASKRQRKSTTPATVAVDKGKQKAEQPGPSTPQSSYQNGPSFSARKFNRDPDTALTPAAATTTTTATTTTGTTKKPKKKATSAVPEGVRQTDIKKQVLSSFLSGGMTVRQMKILLCDLWHRAMDAKLTIYQEIHARELRKRVIAKFYDGDNETVMFTVKKKDKKVYTPPNRLFLPPEFYGYPERIDYEKFELDEEDLWKAVRYFTYLQPTVPPPIRETKAEIKEAAVAKLEQIRERSQPFLIGTGSDAAREAHQNLLRSLERIRANSEIRASNETQNTTQPRQLRSNTEHNSVTHARPLDTTTSTSSPNLFNQPTTSANNTSVTGSGAPIQPFAKPVLQKPPSTSVSQLATTLQKPVQQSTQQFAGPSTMQPSKTSTTSTQPARFSSSPINAASTRPTQSSWNPINVKQPINSSTTQTTKAPTTQTAKASTTQASKAPTTQASKVPTTQTAQQLTQKPPNSTTDTTTSSTPSASSGFKPYRSVVSSLGVKSLVKELEQQPKDKVLEEAFKPIPQSSSHDQTTSSKSHLAEKRSELCSAESSGGVCRVRNCPFQHFRDFQTAQK